MYGISVLSTLVLLGFAAGGFQPKTVFAMVQHASAHVRSHIQHVAVYTYDQLYQQTDDAEKLIAQALPRFQSYDHYGSPGMNFSMFMRSALFAVVGYDIADPTAMFETSLANADFHLSSAPAAGSLWNIFDDLGPEDSVVTEITPPQSPDTILPPEQDDEEERPRLPDIGRIEPEQQPEREERLPQTREDVLAVADWGNAPLIAVVHTHPSEMYRTDTFRPYESHEYHRFDSTNTGIVRVGAQFVNTLQQKYNIPAIHDTTLHNTPCHSCAYRESRQTMQQLVAAYPSLLMILDIHRDGAENVSMLTTVGDEQIAQVTIVTGQPPVGEQTRHPQWQRNQEFAQRVASKMNNRYPGMFRQAMQLTGVYNQDLHPRALLLEVGNYYDHELHALRTAELLADIFAELIYERFFGKEVTVKRE